MMIRFFISAIIAIQSYGLGASGIAQDNVRIELPQTVELSMVVAVISDLDSDGDTVRRSGPYYESVEAYFEAYSDHPFFEALGDNFNLPRLAGNAADFAFNDDGAIIEIDASGSLWKDSDGDLFRRHRELLEDFARQSDFLDFYENHRPEYAQGIDSVARRTNSAAMTRWLEDNFTARPGPMQIIVSPLIYGLNWTTLHKPQTRMWVAPLEARSEDEISDYDRIIEAYAVFTELDHSYVNPVTSRMMDLVEPGFEDLSVWAAEGSSAQTYPTPELQFNEYMTWAVYLMYARDALNDEDYGRLEQIFVSYMSDSRGFIAFADFNREAIRLFAEEGLTGEAIMPEMARWADAYASASQEVSD